MLTLTEQAADAIRGMVADAELGPDAGLRISGTGGGNGDTALDFKLAEAPEEDDEVLRREGAVLFLDPTAAALLTGKTLDVHAHGDHFHFSLGD